MAIKSPFSGLSEHQKYAVVVGGVAVTIGVLVYRHKVTGSWNPLSSGTPAVTASSGAASANNTATITDPNTGDVYSATAVDPSTGETYSAEINQYGSVSNAEASVSDFGTSAGAGTEENYPTGYSYQQASNDLTTANGSNIYTSNSSWAQAVTAGLEDLSGSTSYDGTDIGTALGAYLTGQPLTTGQASVINTAIAEYGPAPIGNLQIIAAPTNVSSPSTMVSVPNVLNDTAGDAHNILVAAGLVPVDPNANAANTDASWKVVSTSPTGGTSVTSGSKVTISTAPGVKVPNIVGQTAGTAHNTLVSAGFVPEDANANASGESSKKVKSQSPAAGSDEPKGSRVSIIT